MHKLLSIWIQYKQLVVWTSNTLFIDTYHILIVISSNCKFTWLGDIKYGIKTKLEKQEGRTNILGQTQKQVESYNVLYPKERHYTMSKKFNRLRVFNSFITAQCSVILGKKTEKVNGEVKNEVNCLHNL